MRRVSLTWLLLACYVISGARAEAHAPTPLADQPLEFPALWELALAHNPWLMEAVADVDAARGRWIQARKYPNPRIAYTEDELGTTDGPPGNINVLVMQEIPTAGKHRLDVAIARQEMDIATLGGLGRKFEVLTRVRRAYYDYVGWQYTGRVAEQVVANLEQGVGITRKLVEQVKTRPRTDLLRLQTLLEEAKITQTNSRVSVEAAWRQLAAELGIPEMPPQSARDVPDVAPRWEAEAIVSRVIAANTDLQQAAAEVDRSRLELDRARAEACPNVSIGGGYSRSFADQHAGGIVSVETTLPLWDRKQGKIYEAQARLTRSQATVATVTDRLHRETAEAFGRYESARHRLERMTAQVLPQLSQTLDLVRKGYEAGAADITFADVLLAQQTLDDARLRFAEARRDLWRAIADLQGLMQLDVGEELCTLCTPK
jgi:cobalt-zinc-cadmium efflux system outer membrane protein